MMATILYISKYGSADPTEASMPFHFAVGALDAGHQPQIALAGEATYLIKDTIAAQIHGMGIPPLKELLQKVIEHGVPIAI
jgi:predicted peroxiredoxin